MPFEAPNSAPQKIAIIGGGVSGLGAAYTLCGMHQVVLFEAEDRLGGHARTVMAGKNGDMPVDTGFLVFNHANYPHLTQMFHDLDVPTAKSNMSFGVSIKGGWMEYGLASMDAIFAQRRNFARPAFLRMLNDLVKFNKGAEEAAKDPTLTIAGLIDKMKLGPWFRDYYLLPFTGAIWSTPTMNILDFPAQALVTFMRNHALLGYNGQHQWHTVDGGSQEYVSRLKALFDRTGVETRTNAPIAGIRRLSVGVEVKVQGGEWEFFDAVICATHSDDTLRMLSDATPAETAALGAVKYQPNHAVLHGDTSVMPKRRKVWSSWVYAESAEQSSKEIDLTYWLNSLQNLPDDDPCFVTLNGQRPVKEELIYDSTTFRHPVFDHGALQAQKQITAMNGANNTWFCGAWMRNGFHEDGFATGVEAAHGLMAQPALLMAAE